MAAGRRVQATGGVGAAAAGWRVSGRQRRTAPQAMARVGGEALPAVSCARRAPPLGVGGGWGAVVGGDLGKEAEGGGGGADRAANLWLVDGPPSPPTH